MPKLSVLMSVFNGESFVKEAVDSVLNQTFSDFEFIIYDDCSTDHSLQIIENYQDTRIKLIKNAKNKGLTANLHDGMDLAQGDFLARMDADDICMSDRFQKQLDYFAANPDISILGTGVIFFDETGREILGTQPLTHDEIKIELLLGFTLLHPSVMMRLSDMRKYNLNYDTHFRYSQDFDLWVRASHVLKFANLHEPLIKMREHANKISRALKPEQKSFSDEIRERQLVELGLNLSSEELSIFHSYCSICYPENCHIKQLDTILCAIIDLNRIYNSELLKAKAADFFKYICYSLLKINNRDGLYYWKSKVRVYEKWSIPLFFRILYRSIKTLRCSSLVVNCGWTANRVSKTNDYKI